MSSLRAALLAGLGFGAMAAAPAAAQFGPPPPLADGAGKETVETLCASCHPTGNINGSSGYTREQWDALTATMIDLKAIPETQAEVLDYLAAHYPPNDSRAATPVDGPLTVSFTEWVAPTLGQRARDPVEAPDGSIWWVGQFGNIVGRLDPETGAMQEWVLPPQTLPHSVTLDKDGTPWVTGNGNGTLVKLDPATGEFTVYPMPDPAATDPHTAEFDSNGILWFSLQRSNMIGRFDPTSGEIELKTLPTPRSNPYGVKIAANGAPYVACNGGGGCLIRVNPDTFELTEIKLPTEGTTTRRLDIADDGIIWFVNSAQGKIGRYDPSTGDIEEWDSPSGPRSHPYGMAVVDGIVWYNESGVRPDMLVRFDPATETFQSWPIPSGPAGDGELYAGIVRHMRATADGDLLIHQSSTNRIIRVDLPPAE
jgi:virginiamycin B lyase